MISKQELKEIIEKLEKIRGRHTELITVCIPSGTNIYTVAGQIDAEKSTADNIKSKTTRKNVMDALESVSRELKLYKQTPKNGLVIFCGNISDKEGEQDLKLWAIEPPNPLNIRLYRCDQEFVLEPLKEMLEASETYGLVVMDRKEATLGLLEGKQIKVLRKLTSGVPGKIRAGGQCLHLSTLIETNKGFKKIYEIKEEDKIKGYNFKNNKITFSKVLKKWEVNKKGYRVILTNKNSLICSNDHTLFVKEKGINESLASSLDINNLLIGKIKNKIEELKIDSITENKANIQMIDLETEARNFFANGILVHNSSQRFERITEGLAKEFFRRIAEAMREIYFDMPKLKGIIIGGPIPTKDEFMKEGQLVTKLKNLVIGLKDIGNTDESGLEDLVVASHDLLEQQEIIREKKILENFFELLGKGKKAVYKKSDIEKALNYGAIDVLIVSSSHKNQEIKDLISRAEAISAKIEFVSTETPEGEQFFNLGGLGAVLRFEI